MTNINGKIPNIAKDYNGLIHDFKIRKMSDHIPKDLQVLADLGYQGLRKQNPQTILTHKQRRKIPLSA